MKVLTEMGSKPEETMAKYGNNPQFRELLTEFNGMMGNHFNALADDKKAEEEKKQKEEEKKMQDDPVMQILNSDEEVKNIL